MIKLGIIGYGNLSRAAIDNLKNFPDIKLEAIFTRRPDSVKIDFPVFGMQEIASFKDKIDVMLLCGGSATDLPEQTPAAAKLFNIVDSFDNHAKILQHREAVDASLKQSKKLGVISVGWDPGLFSIARAYFNAFLPQGNDYTFWGKGVSQGHSDAIRRIEGVSRGVQYTIPKDDALNSVRSGKNPALSTRQKHLRECFVVAADGADKEKIRQNIVSMPNYFADYDVVVNFITEEEFERDHKKMPHGGFVIRSGESAANNNNVLELSIKLDSNPHFTSSIMLSYARAVYRMYNEGQTGCLTAYDIPPSKLYSGNIEDLIGKLL